MLHPTGELTRHLALPVLECPHGMAWGTARARGPDIFDTFVRLEALQPGTLDVLPATCLASISLKHKLYMLYMVTCDSTALCCPYLLTA